MILKSYAFLSTFSLFKSNFSCNYLCVRNSFYCIVSEIMLFGNNMRENTKKKDNSTSWVSSKIFICVSKIYCRVVKLKAFIIYYELLYSFLNRFFLICTELAPTSLHSELIHNTKLGTGESWLMFESNHSYLTNSTN